MAALSQQLTGNIDNAKRRSSRCSRIQAMSVTQSVSQPGPSSPQSDVHVQKSDAKTVWRADVRAGQTMTDHFRERLTAFLFSEASYDVAWAASIFSEKILALRGIFSPICNTGRLWRTNEFTVTILQKRDISSKCLSAGISVVLTTTGRAP